MREKRKDRREIAAAPAVTPILRRALDPFTFPRHRRSTAIGDVSRAGSSCVTSSRHTPNINHTPSSLRQINHTLLRIWGRLRFCSANSVILDLLFHPTSRRELRGLHTSRENSEPSSSSSPSAHPDVPVAWRMAGPERQMSDASLVKRHFRPFPVTGNGRYAFRAQTDTSTNFLAFGPHAPSTNLSLPGNPLCSNIHHTVPASAREMTSESRSGNGAGQAPSGS